MQSNRVRRVGLLGLGCALAMTLALAPAPASAAERVDIPAGDLVAALDTLARQTGVEFIYRADQLQGKRTAGVAGSLTAEDALDRLLQGSGFTAKRDPSGAVLIVKRTESEADRGAARPVPPQPAIRRSGATAAPPSAVTDIDAVMVTGSHIRGAAPAGSPLQVFDRAAIEDAGFGTVKDFLEKLPQNFGGDGAEDVAATDAGAGNRQGAIGVNLRGLGANATLVLVNGRRRAQLGSSWGSFVDVSNIPLSAIDRIEVLTDGASAVYGADAIAGVINFVLRTDYEGSETGLRYADSTAGGGREMRVSQTFGKSGPAGSFLVSYEYYDRANLTALQRPYTAFRDFSAYGLQDFRVTTSSPGTIVSPALAAIPSGQNGTGLAPEDLLLGQANRSDNLEGMDLLPAVKRHSAFMAGRLALGPRAELFAELGYADRRSVRGIGPLVRSFIPVTSANPYFVSPVPGASLVYVDYNFINEFGNRDSPSTSLNLGGMLGMELVLFSDWRSEMYLAHEKERTTLGFGLLNAARLNEALGTDNPGTSFNPATDGYFNLFGDGSGTARNVLDFVNNRALYAIQNGYVSSAVAKVDGSIMRIPGGEVKLALGGDYRRSGYDSISYTVDDGVRDNAPLARAGRDVRSIFAELSVPLVGQDNARPGMHRLALSAAMRHEDYSDFGATRNPKLGIRWEPTEGLGVRGSWGTSFNAPRLQALVPPRSLSSVALMLPDPASPTGTTTVLLMNGINRNLKPETSTAWTFGLDFSPSRVPGLDIGLTYYDLDYEDRIAAIPTADLANFFFDLATYGPIISRMPDRALVQDYMNDPVNYRNNTGRPLSVNDIEATIDARSTNLGRTRVRGLDMNLRYGRDTLWGYLDFSLNGSYMLEFRNALTATSPLKDELGTFGNPIDLQLRGKVSWTRGPYAAHLFVNHAGSYGETYGAGAWRSIDAWTTLDVGFRYDPGAIDTAGPWRNAVLSLMVQNLLDKDPPFALGVVGTGYDPANADPLGRLVSASLTWAW